jgi:hypothetical protein
MKALKVLKYTGFGILGVGAMFFFVWLVMLLWNALIPELFNGPVLSYWQTAGIMVLSKILLSGFGGGGGSKSSSGKSKHKSKWMSKYHDKYKDGCRDKDIKVEDAKVEDADLQAQPE